MSSASCGLSAELDCCRRALSTVARVWRLETTSKSFACVARGVAAAEALQFCSAGRELESALASASTPSAPAAELSRAELFRLRGGL